MQGQSSKRDFSYPLPAYEQRGEPDAQIAPLRAPHLRSAPLRALCSSNALRPPRGTCIRPTVGDADHLRRDHPAQRDLMGTWSAGRATVWSGNSGRSTTFTSTPVVPSYSCRGRRSAEVVSPAPKTVSRRSKPSASALPVVCSCPLFSALNQF